MLKQDSQLRYNQRININVDNKINDKQQINKEMIDDVKVVVIGSVGVGKSSLTARYVNDDFNETMPTTLGATYLQKVHQNGKLKFQLWDTAGQQKFRSIAKIYYRDARVAIVVYDRSKKQSFESVKAWMDELHEKGPQNITLAIVGNKIDKLQQEIPTSQASKYAKEHDAIFMETSAKDGRGINELFNLIALSVLNKKPILKQSQAALKKNKKNKKSGCC